jgi:hypothetical protein
MIVQITITKNECFLLKEMLPIWSKYADGFLFYNDDSTDDTLEFLEQNKEKYNILSIINRREDNSKHLKMESNMRQQLYDEALKYTDKIICMDSDEYLESDLTKENLENILDQATDCTFYLQWVQYASKDTVRVDGSWKWTPTDRIGKYNQRALYPTSQSHSLHLPQTTNAQIFPPDVMYIAHLQWLDKRWVGVKQYYWKVWDYINRLIHNVKTIGSEGYDHSVNNFEWEYAYAPKELRVREDIYKVQDMKKNDKLLLIQEYTQKYDIPNLGDWGMGIYDYITKKNNTESKDR